MNPHRSSPAENTAAIVQQAAHGGWPLMIPGVWEPRLGRAVIRPAYPTVVSTTSDAHRAVTGDRNEREAGGAPRERRRPGRYRAALARLWHWAVDSADIPIAGGPFPEER